MQKLFRFLKILTIRFFDDLCPMRAASLTFTTLLSIAPLVIFIFYVLSFFPQLQASGMRIEQFIVHNFVANSANTISQELENFISQSRVLSWTTIISLVSIGFLMIFNMVDAVNGVWHVKMRRDSVIPLTLYLIVLIIAPIVFAILIAVSSYLTPLPLLSDFMTLSPFFIEWVSFSLFHWIMPSCRVYFRYAVIAGLITTILFELAKWGFVLYFHYFSMYQLVYGALAAIPIFFLWIYVSWLIVILGALICQLLQTHYRHENT